jgi:hypothetical protein
LLQLRQKTQAMKKLLIITTALILITGLSAFATGKPGSVFIEKNLYQLSFSKIIVEDDIDVRLSENSDRLIEISGREKYVKAVNWKIKDGVLFLSSKAGSLKKKVLVSISVTELKALAVKGNSDIKSEGALNSNELKVFVAGEGSVALQTTGSIGIEKSSHLDLEVERMAGDVKIEW